ncbi:Zinc finger A20 and AN1 domain-containing stress-associated protein 6 [Euphorbia peplus]|nr:Zinc finger A20 and AN1 domain-containing stress-associated protein 6 [Euphorbia peplus]
MNSQSLCVKGCGFYGASENHNMCSKCYKDHLKQELVKSVLVKKPVTAEIEVYNESRIEESSPSLRKNRCENCKKKVGLTGFNCRCGKLLCGMHRYPKEHSCVFDFKDSDRRVLAKQNVLVKADKLDTRI